MEAFFVVHNAEQVDNLPLLLEVEVPLQHVDVVVAGADSIYESRMLYRLLEALQGEYNFKCPTLPRLGRLAALGAEMGRVEDLFEELREDINDSESLLLLKNSAWIVRGLAKSVGGAVRVPCINFANRLLRRIHGVQTRRQDIFWFQDLLPAMEEDLHALQSGIPVPFK